MGPYAPASKRLRSPGTHSAGGLRSFRKSMRSPALSFITTTQRHRCMATSPRSEPENMSQSTFWSEAHLASLSASPDSEVDWTMSAATWPSNILGWLTDCGPGGWFGRTCPASCHRTEDGTLEPSSGGWSNSGMASPTECLTLSTSESPSSAVASSLSAVLETGDLPRQCFLSARACRGYLRRLPTIMSQTPTGGQARLGYLIASMQAMAESGEATNGTLGTTSSSAATGDPAAPPSLK